MQAVIIAGGRGSRLGQMSATLPKALVGILGRPLLDYTLDLLRRSRVREVILCTGHLAEEIETFVGDGSVWRLRVRYSRESSPLGTAGCLSAIQPLLAGDFLVLYADLLMELDLMALAEFHRHSAADATLVVHPNGHPHDSDLVTLDADSRIQALHKKPHPPGPLPSDLVSAACYVLRPTMLDLLVPGEKADCFHDLFSRALARGRKLFGYRTAEYLKDAGTPDRLKQVEDDLRSGRVNPPRPASSTIHL